ncbi:MAG: T9SS type A sorting domain-containing protein [Candidatus Competibacteraceae bacterium]|nr:T9SS type A sorting domain-containing protein [Candidatus Competibacteraceae bacterium]
MKKLFTIFVIALNCYGGMGQSTFQIDVVNGNAEIDAASTYCEAIWGEYLNSNVPIKIKLYYANLSGSTLGITIPNGRRDFPGAPIDSTWYPTSLANALAGYELNVGEDDMNIFMDNSANWYFGLDGNTPSGKYDFVSVLMHEIAHGLGFMALTKIEGGQGSFGYITPIDLAPLIFSFPFPNLEGKYSVYATFMENLSGNHLDDTSLYQNPSNALASQFTSNQIYFNGSFSYVANNNQRVRLFAPSTFEFGSSLHHLNESSYPAGNPNSMMTPYIAAGESHHHPGPVAIAMLQDMGWSVNTDASFEDVSEIQPVQVFPNPASTFVFVQTINHHNEEILTVMDMQGRLVFAEKWATDKYLSVENWPDGVYVINYKGYSRKILKIASK